MTQPIDYQAVLADLERRRAAFNDAIDAAIGSIRKILALSVVAPIPQVTVKQSEPKPAPTQFMLDTNVFKDMSLADAAIKHLRVVGKPQTNQDIAAALEAAGFPHGSSNFPNLVGTALWRESQKKRLTGPKVSRDGRLWHLSEWQEEQSA